eukprot:COSAG06_NODE_16211_length_1013_cov_1.308534_2_plen_235_part_01
MLPNTQVVLPRTAAPAPAELHTACQRARRPRWQQRDQRRGWLVRSRPRVAPATAPRIASRRTNRCRTLSQPLRLLSNRGRAVQRCAARCSSQSCLSRGVVLRAAASHPSPGRDRPLPLFERQCPCRGAPPLFSCQHPCALHCAATAAERQLLSNGIVPVPRVALPPRRLRRPLLPSLVVNTLPNLEVGRVPSWATKKWRQTHALQGGDGHGCGVGSCRSGDGRCHYAKGRRPSRQ